MKIAAEERRHEMNIMGSAQTFKINADPKAFQILSDSLYKEKELAILRELVANAFDSHKDAGTLDTPFNIHIPTTMEPWFEIKDFGTGLTERQIYKLYTTYFGSNKSQSNDFIGGLGLGSKSPFSYTDQFTVKSRKDGVEMLFNIYIGEDGVPMVAKTGVAKTEEANGLTVNVPATNSSHREFLRAAEKILPYLPMPYTSNFEEDAKQWETIEYVAEMELDVLGQKLTVKERPNAGYYNESRVVMGIVPYPLSDLRDVGSEDPMYILRHFNLDVIAPIGTFEVAASREALSYNSSTKKALNALALALIDELTEDVDKRLNEADTAFHYASMLETFRRGVIGAVKDLIACEGKWKDDYKELYKRLKGIQADGSKHDFKWKNKEFKFAVPKTITVRAIQSTHSRGWRSTGKNVKTNLYERWPGKDIGLSEIDRMRGLVGQLHNDDDDEDANLIPPLYWIEKPRKFIQYFEDADMDGKYPSLMFTGPKADVAVFLKRLGVDFFKEVEEIPKLTINKGASANRKYGATSYSAIVFDKDKAGNDTHSASLTIADALEKVDGDYGRLIVTDQFGASKIGSLSTFTNPYYKAKVKLPIVHIMINSHHTKKIENLVKDGALKDSSDLFDVDQKQVATTMAFNNICNATEGHERLAEALVASTDMVSKGSRLTNKFGEAEVAFERAKRKFPKNLPPEVIKAYQAVYRGHKLKERWMVTVPDAIAKRVDKQILAERTVRVNKLFDRIADLLDKANTKYPQHKLLLSYLKELSHWVEPSTYMRELVAGDLFKVSKE